MGNRLPNRNRLPNHAAPPVKPSPGWRHGKISRLGTCARTPMWRLKWGWLIEHLAWPYISMRRFKHAFVSTCMCQKWRNYSYVMLCYFYLLCYACIICTLVYGAKLSVPTCLSHMSKVLLSTCLSLFVCFVAVLPCLWLKEFLISQSCRWAAGAAVVLCPRARASKRCPER